MSRLILLAIAIVIIAVLGKSILEVVKGVGAARASRRRAADPEGYDWEPKTDQIYRRIKAVSVPGEDREAILAFIESRTGVEAFMEPRTLMNSLSVVLVAIDGEWSRFELKDDSFIRDLAKRQGLRVYDAGKVGYPERMRRYRKDKDAGPE